MNTKECKCGLAKLTDSAISMLGHVVQTNSPLTESQKKEVRLMRIRFDDINKSNIK